MVNLVKIIFGCHFNHPLNNSLLTLVNLKELTFGHNFNHPLEDSLSNLPNLTILTLGYEFNQRINIPDWIKKITLHSNTQHFIDFLPSNIEELVLCHHFDLELDDLPSSIKKIKILNEHYNKKLNNLPTKIELLEISYRYKVPIEKEYKNLNIIKFIKN